MTSPHGVTRGERGGSKKLKFGVTSFMDGPLREVFLYELRTNDSYRELIIVACFASFTPRKLTKTCLFRI